MDLPRLKVGAPKGIFVFVEAGLWPDHPLAQTRNFAEIRNKERISKLMGLEIPRPFCSCRNHLSKTNKCWYPQKDGPKGTWSTPPASNMAEYVGYLCEISGECIFWSPVSFRDELQVHEKYITRVSGEIFTKKKTTSFRWFNPWPIWKFLEVA